MRSSGGVPGVGGGLGGGRSRSGSPAGGPRPTVPSMSGDDARAPRDLAEVLNGGRGEDAEVWRTVHDAMPEGLVVVSPDRRILYANRAAGRLMRVPPEQAVGQACTDVIDCPRCECVCGLFRHGEVRDVEVAVFAPDRRVVRKNARLLRDAGGRVVAGVETWIDVTEASREEAGRDGSSGPVPPAFGSDRGTDVVEGWVAIDERGAVSGLSGGFARFVGRERSELVGRALPELLGLGRLASRSVEQWAEQRLPVASPVGGPGAEIEFTPQRYGVAPLLGVLRPRRVGRPEADQLEARYGYAGMLSTSPSMRAVFDLVEQVAGSDVNVLIEGESGVGKELVARAIHDRGPRRDNPFFAVNCATFTGSLLLSELFGHERGAFTGAVEQRKGKLEVADSGTLLLDEVSEIPLEHQALLLRVLESRRFERLGSSRSIAFEARVVAAANRRLGRAAEEGRFRSDLYYRLNVVPVRIPPLRERPEDVELLLRYFLARADRPGRDVPDGFSPAAMDRLVAHPWPGNVRELRNLVEYLCFAVRGTVEPEHLPASIGRAPAAVSSEGPTAPSTATPSSAPAPPTRRRGSGRPS